MIGAKGSELDVLYTPQGVPALGRGLAVVATVPHDLLVSGVP